MNQPAPVQLQSSSSSVSSLKLDVELPYRGPLNSRRRSTIFARYKQKIAVDFTRLPASFPPIQTFLFQCQGAINCSRLVFPMRRLLNSPAALNPNSNESCFKGPERGITCRYEKLAPASRGDLRCRQRRYRPQEYRRHVPRYERRQ
jgi:hypothetical protein